MFLCCFLYEITVPYIATLCQSADAHTRVHKIKATEWLRITGRCLYFMGCYLVSLAGSQSFALKHSSQSTLRCGQQACRL